LWKKKRVNNMINPLDALVIALVILAVISFLFWPGRGAVAEWRRSKRYTKRVLIEDALKHLYDYESKDVKVTLQSIAGHLSISGDQTAELVSKLEEMGLISSQSGSIELTSGGRSYALRVIRIHRLWERYLADETSVTESEWHAEAEEKEHNITPTQANILAAQMGNPLIDPHGDPIPSATGELHKIEGIPLSSLPNGEFARIIHIEDEPWAIYSQLIAIGLHAGMQIRMIDSTSERIRFEAEGEECVLAPLFANNVTVSPLHKEKKTAESFKTLSSLCIGEEGVVVGISKACRGQQRRRLLDFGVVPGTVIKAEIKSVGGDPIAYRIRGANVALRKKHTDQIYIKKSDGVKNAAS
jgi:DtxR family Mn-dependent transcriptional regulator